jgi:hypothetical protein
MKDLNRIEELLEKYYRGETTTDEEKELRRFFAGGDVPRQLAAEAGLFGYYAREREDALSGEMEERLEKMVAGSRKRIPVVGMRHRYYWLSGAAAAILILIGMLVDRQIRENTSPQVRKDTYEDPYIAYVEAKRVLYMVSETMNKGREPLQNLEKLNAGTDYIHPVFSFGSGIQHLEHLSKIDKARELISR